MNNETPVSGLLLVSTVFRDGTQVPPQYTCKGENVNPPLSIINPPNGTQSYALIMHDPDAPGGDYLHWLVWDISSKTDTIAANSVPVGAIQGFNDSGSMGYTGPCPPPGTGEHRYMFELYALDTTLGLPKETDRETLENAIESHTIEHVMCTGLFGVS